MRSKFLYVAIAVILLTSLSSAAQAQTTERLCDTAFEDCRAPLWQLIDNETVGIDIAYWFMQDTSIANKVLARHAAGVPVRILVDPRANPTYAGNEMILNQFKNAGIPMREKYNTSEDILHFKIMLFDGQNMVEFSKANYSPEEFIPIQPNVNYSDEAIFFTNDTRLTNSFRRRFDDRWIDTTVFRNYANVGGALARRYSGVSIDPSMNFPPTQDFLARGFSRRNFGRIATMLTAGASLPFFSESSMAQLSAVRGMPVLFSLTGIQPEADPPPPRLS